MQPRSEAEDDERARGHERRVQALRQREPVEHEHDGPPAENADDGAEHGLLGQHRQHVSPRPFARRQILDQKDGEQDRERIVAAGFDLERSADAGAQAQAAGMDQEEHRRGIGRGHDRTHQQQLAPAHVEQVLGDRSGQPRRDHDADGRQRGRGRQHAAEGRQPGTQAAVEQDQGQRDRADQIGHPHVVELDAARSGLAREHADDQEHQQQRGPETGRNQTGHDAGQDQQRTEQNADAERVEKGYGVRLHDSYWKGCDAQRQ